MKNDNSNSFLTSLLAGAVAGLTVDLTLFPLDTLKTRLQSKQGFWRAGGFTNIYKGVETVALGSVPCAAIFLATYEIVKLYLCSSENGYWTPLYHMSSASLAELSVKTVHVPMEIVKQRRQVSGLSPIKIIKLIMKEEGIVGFYRGLHSTLARDIPYSIIEFPMWEGLKAYWYNKTLRKVSPIESALCGAIAGAVAAALTTPADIIKTRIMLSENTSEKKQHQLANVVKEIYKNNGFKGFYIGFLPRVLMVFLGSGIFFGCYEFSRNQINCSNFGKLI
uniref:S-adenosylmethionine mitochondrial carrier protein n=1 Tax=Clastoptera arizonana TaxID=38151 RepID=A0A1B6E939_9HEMI